ncbi:MAG: hypothetical protein V1836_01685 [Candidatus Aenigmatarchaeota archaeon]
MEISKLFSQRGLVIEHPDTEEIRARADSRKPDATRIFYGETYDDYGNTIDSMKYYFFVSELGKSLRDNGWKTEPTILVADSAACRNVSDNLKYRYMQLGKERADFVKTVNEVYGTGLKVIKMSEYIDSPEFQKRLAQVSKICNADPSLMEMVEKTVPPSKTEIEKQRGFGYSFDEINTILNFDIKVGPPREDLYDSVSRRVADKLGYPRILSVFLSPTFPVGLGWSYFFSHEEEEFGITAYKADSKRLHANRIIAGRTTPEEARALIERSFISKNPSLPNPVLDIGIISEMAGKRLKGESSPLEIPELYYEGKITPEELRRTVADSLGKNIILVLR